MTVGQAIEIAREWVEENGSKAPGFCGAHLTGAISGMSKEASFPIYRDVDIGIVVRDTAQTPVRQDKVLYKGILLEYVFYGFENYESPEAMLSNPLLAHTLAVESVIVDPTGMLTQLQQVVAQGYPQKRWVRARCEAAKRSIIKWLDQMSYVNSPTDALGMLEWIISYLGVLIAIAHLRPPTVRRCLTLTRKLLQSRGRLALYEAILELGGSAQMDVEQVKTHLRECVRAFEYAVVVKRTRCFGDYNIHPYVRPYLVKGSQEMIEEGNHREAMFWIVFFHGVANQVIQSDAPEEEKSSYQAGFECLLRGLGLLPLSNWQSRIQLARNVAEQCFMLADEMVETNPALIV